MYKKCGLPPNAFLHILQVPMSTLQLLALVAAIAAVTHAQSLTVVNDCSESVLLYTQTSYGSISNYVNVNAGASVDMGISTNWDGAVNVG